MDPSFFGLSDHPFEKTQASDDAGILAEAHNSLITELRAGLKAPHGITLVIGDTGAGKTAFARSLSGRMSDTATVAFLPTTGPGLRHILSEAIEQLGGDTAPAADEDALLESLKSIAKARAEHFRPTVIVVDDAQELPAKTLERLSKLFGDDPAEPSMLHVILVGRQELLDRMNAANDRSILKHLIQVCRMDPIGPEDSFRYIAERVRMVGGVAHELFSEAALKRIVTLAKGVPCRIDRICAASLEEAAARGDKEVGEEIVTSASMNVESRTGENGMGEHREESAFTLGDVPDNETDTSDPRASTGAVSLARLKTLYESRRRLLLWGGIFVAALAGFAAALTGTPGDDTAAGGPAALQDTQLAAGDERKSEPMQAAKTEASTKASKRAPVAELNSVPKLVLSKDGSAPATPKSATPANKAKPTASGTVTKKLEPAVAKQAPPSVTRQQAKPSAKPATKPAEKQMAKAPTRPTPTPAPAKTPAAPIVRSRVTSPAKAAAKPSAPVAAPKVAPTAKSAPAAKPAPVKTAKATAPATAIGALSHGFPGRYTVQIGAYGVRANAEAAMAKVNARYADARIIVVDAGGKRVYRVVSGAFENKSAAARRQTSLVNSGFKTFVRVMK